VKFYHTGSRLHTKDRAVALKGRQEGLQQGQAVARAIGLGLLFAREGNFEEALKKFQIATAASPTLPTEVLNQTIADGQRKDNPALTNFTTARQYYFASQGVAATKTGDFEKASSYLRQAGDKNPMLPIKFIDQAILDAESKNDPIQSNFKVARQDYMNDTDPFSQTDPAYRD
jgi:tetratricopeptide (TPR) repeat protein